MPKILPCRRRPELVLFRPSWCAACRRYKGELKPGDSIVLESDGEEEDYLLARVHTAPRQMSLKGGANDANHFYGNQWVVDAVLFTCTTAYTAGGEGRYSMLKGAVCSKPTSECTVECCAERPHFQTFALNSVREPVKQHMRRVKVDALP